MDFGLLVRVGLLFARPGMLIMSAPVFGGHFAPTHVRIGLALLITLILMPVVDVPDVVSISELGLVLARELAIGLAFSLSLRALIAGAELGGHLTGSQLMLSYGSTIDPQGGVRSNLIAALYGNLTMLTFFTVSGHHALLRGLTNSYLALPIGLGEVDDSLVRGVMQLLGVVFVFGLRLAAPIILVMMIVELGTGLISRAAPAISLQVIGMPVRIFVGLLAVAATVPLVSGLATRFVTVASEIAVQIAQAFR